MLDLEPDPAPSGVVDGEVVEAVAVEVFEVDLDGGGGAEHEVDERGTGDDVLVCVAVVGCPECHFLSQHLSRREWIFDWIRRPQVRACEDRPFIARSCKDEEVRPSWRLL